MSSISDPGRPSRGDRKRVQRLVDDAYAKGDLSAAERALRTQRVDAAHTRGDLAMIARDLGEDGSKPAGATSRPASTDPGSASAGPSTTPSLGSAIDPQVLRSMQVGGTYRASGTAGTPTINLAGMATAARRIRIVVLVVILGFLGFCGLGVAALVPSFVEGFKSASTPVPTGAPTEVVSASPGASQDAVPSSESLHSAAGWTALVNAIKARSGSTSVYDLVVYPTYAAVGMDGGKEVQRGLFRDGAWVGAVNVRTPIVGSPVDLAAIDPRVIAKLPAQSAQRLGVEHPTGTYLVVNAILSSPKILVYVQSDSGSQYVAYTLDGTPAGV